jgi:RNA polymerase sigma-70 factor (ECF subfamily)
MLPEPDSIEEQFIREFTDRQGRLYGLILSMIPDPERARDVLQETNVVIWRKRHEFTPGTNFGAWCARIACYQVAAYREKLGRDRHVFDDDLIAALSEESIEQFCSDDDRAQALDSCLQQLSRQERNLIESRYARGNSIADAAAIAQKSLGATRVLLFRIRQILLECVQNKMARPVDSR